MNYLDITTYIMNNIVMGAILGIALAGFTAIITGFITDAIMEMEYKKSVKIVIFSVITVFIITVMVSLIPTHEKILKVKIAKIKNEVVTEQNLNQSIETIERIGKKLEKKYLGGE